MLFDDLTCLGREFQRVGSTTEKALLPWVPKKAGKIDMKILRKKLLIGNGIELENNAGLDREPMK